MTHPDTTNICTICAANSFPPPPINNPYGLLGWLEYTSFTYDVIANNHVNKTTHASHPPCNCAGSSGFSYFNFSVSLLHPIKTHDATKPHMIVAQGSTIEPSEVIATNPTSRPLQTSSTLFQWSTYKRLLNKVVRAPMQPSNAVLIVVLPMALHCNKTNITVWPHYREKWTWVKFIPTKP